MTFGEKIRSNRIKNKMSQKQLANLLFLTPQTISKWENDLSQPDFQIVTQLTKIFNISHDELFNEEFEVNDESIIYSAVKDIRMKKNYNNFLLLSIFLSIAMIMTSVYISKIEGLPVYFTLGLSMLTLFWIVVLFFVAKWRNNYYESIDQKIDVYQNHIFIHDKQLTIPFQHILKISFHKYQFYSGIRIYDNNGYFVIKTALNEKIIVRDVLDILDLKKVIEKKLYKEDLK